MKLKRCILYFGLALWLIAFFQMIKTRNLTETEEEAIVTAFAENDFLNTVSTIKASGLYKNTYLTETEREALLLEIAHHLGITNSLVYDSITEDGVTTSTLVRTSEHAKTVFSLITTETETSSSEVLQKHLIRTEIEFDNSLESAFYYRDLLKNAFEQVGVNPDISIYLKGEINGSLSMTQKNVITDNIIQSSGGEIVTESRTGNLFTVYAYTDKIDDYVLTGSMKTNLNVAISYDEINDITEVRMATPFINSDY